MRSFSMSDMMTIVAEATQRAVPSILKRRHASVGDLSMTRPVYKTASNMSLAGMSEMEYSNTPRRKSVTFCETVRVAQTYSRHDYDREAVKRKRRLDELISIREELIKFKTTEMVSHAESVQNIHIYKPLC
eukprot:Colp12_sorted_trinity150504_noHs@15328